MNVELRNELISNVFVRELELFTDLKTIPLLEQEKIAKDANKKAIDATKELTQYTRETYGTQFKGKYKLLDNVVYNIYMVEYKNFSSPKYSHIETEMVSNQMFMAYLLAKVYAMKTKTAESAKLTKMIRIFVKTIATEITQIVLHYRPLLPPQMFDYNYNWFIKNYHFQDVLSNLVIVEKEPILTGKSLTMECPICYTNYKKQQTVTLNCNHTFCAKCIERFTKTNIGGGRGGCTCPMCRTKIESIKTHTKTSVTRFVNNSNKRNTFIELTA